MPRPPPPQVTVSEAIKLGAIRGHVGELQVAGAADVTALAAAVADANKQARMQGALLAAPRL